jgi:hypothetical protein
MILKRELEFYQFEKGRGLQPRLKGEASHPVSTSKHKNRVLAFEEDDGFDRLYILQAAQLTGIKQTMPEPRLNELLKICQVSKT